MTRRSQGPRSCGCKSAAGRVLRRPRATSTGAPCVLACRDFRTPEHGPATPTLPSRAASSLSRSGLPRRALGAQAARRRARRARALRRPPDHGGRRRTARVGRPALPRVPPRARGHEAPRERLPRRRVLAARSLQGHGRRGARRGSVRLRRHARDPGAAPLVARARDVLPLARGDARASGAGERLLHAALGAGTAGSPRHARRLLPADRGREALARVRARVGAAAEGPALRLEARRSGRARPRRHAAARATPVPTSRLAARGEDVRHGLAAPDDRRKRLLVARRVQGRARGVRRRRGVPALTERAPRRTCSNASASGSARTTSAAGCARDWCGAGGRCSKASSGICAPCATSTWRPSSSGGRRCSRTSSCTRTARSSRSRGARSSFPSTSERRWSSCSARTSRFALSDLPGTLDEEGRLALVARLVREGLLVSR